VKVEKFGKSEASSATEAAALARLKQRIERAIDRGSISQAERRDILQQIYADGRVTAQECELFRQLQERVWSGALHLEL